MFNVTNHQGIANQNHNKVSPHTCQNGYYQKRLVLVRMWRKGEFLCIAYGIGTATVENSMEVPQKIENETTTLCVVIHISHVWPFATLWIIACQGPLSMGILQTWILEWVSTSSSRGSSPPRDQTRVSYIYCIARQILYHYHHLGSRAVIWSSNSTLVYLLEGNKKC